jgi:hypothetical protein
MKRKFTVVALLLCLSSLACAKAVSARTWAPGVAEGDFFYYEMYGVYTSSDPNATIEVPPFERNNTDWVRIDIADVSGSIVYQVYTLHFKNGKERTFDLWTDLDPGSLSTLEFSDKGVPICGANLSVGDSLPTVQLTINETRIWTYPDGERKINCVSWDSPDDWGQCYFDKVTGVLVELHRVHSFVNPVTGEIVYKADVVELTRSSRWDEKDMPPRTTAMAPKLIALNAVALPLFAVAWHKHKSAKKTKCQL